MNYREDKYGNKLSMLGYGCMRFQKKRGRIDMQQAEAQIMCAYHNGVNYFDTAYIYPGSEAAIGEIFEKNGIRKDIYIATKLPHYLIKNRETLDKLFNEQLKRLRTDYIDYYLMHMLTDTATWERLKELGILEWIAQKKKSGAIRQIGFSYHGNSDMFCELVDAYDWDFCMIQYNYMDEHSQAGRKGLHYAHKKGLSVMIMEPLRGGRLAGRLPKDAVQLFDNFSPRYSPAAWSFRWLWNQSEVTVVLSGMNSEQMILENVQTAEKSAVGAMTEAEETLLREVVGCINRSMKVGCTGCAYCVPCPQKVDIPGVFSAYNRKFTEGWFVSMKEYFMCTAFRKNSTAASACIGCGKCEKHCPQGIPIREKLKDAQKEMETPLYRMVRAIAKIFIRL